MKQRKVTFTIRNLKKMNYLQLSLCWVMHHSMSPQAFLMKMRLVTIYKNSSNFIDYSKKSSK